MRNVGPGGEFGGGGRYGDRGARNGPSPRILVVDDSPSARTIMQGQLLRLGVPLPDLRMASTIQEALQYFTQWNPDLVFVDLELRTPRVPTPSSAAPVPATPAAPPNGGGTRLPQNGSELTLQFLSRNPSLSVVICSAKEPDDPTIKEHARTGRVRVIVKPVVAAKVQTVLDAFKAPERRTISPP